MEKWLHEFRRDQVHEAARLAAEAHAKSPVGEPLFAEWSGGAVDNQTSTEVVITNAEDASAKPVNSRFRQRELTGPELRLMKVLKRKRWVVNSQPPPEGKHGPEAVINYLACYVTGACISDARLISDVDGQVTIRIKDYKAGGKALVTYAGSEIVRRFTLHILPRTLGRVRYAGIFAAAGREGRLEKVRQLIAQQKGKQLGDESLPLFDDFDQPLPSDNENIYCDGEDVNSAVDNISPEESEEDSKYPPKCCNRCQARLETVGTLRGVETAKMIKLAEAIDTRLEEHAPMLRIELMAMMVGLFQRFWQVDQLPHAVRDLFANHRLTYIESSALSALLERKISAPVYPEDDCELATTSGIPPPEDLIEANHAAA